MAWVIGIDEAGYGPNLGPFVMTCVACRLPDDLAGADLWHRLRDAVRRPDERDDGRIPVGDSKAVYSPARGLRPLEAAVLAFLDSEGPAVSDYIDLLCPHSHAALRGECWYAGTTPLPAEAGVDDVSAARARLADVCRGASVVWATPRSVVVCPGEFNRLADAAGSKGAVLRHALAEAVRPCWEFAGAGEPLEFVVDKHGGRNAYAALLQDLVPSGMVVAREEGAARSVYDVRGLGRPARWTFRPRADADSFCVALASMVSKYFREVLMREFNAFWISHVPGLRPTAGYPTDARRFFASVRPLLAGLGLPEDAVWRRR